MSSRLRPATPASSRRAWRPMPRQARRATPPPARERQRTIFGRRLPVSPLVVGLVVLFIVVAGVAWAVEGRFETPPSQLAKQVLPFKGEDVQAVTLQKPGAAPLTYTRDASDTFSDGRPVPAPTPVPPPEATPAPVVLAPSTRIQSATNQFTGLQVERVILTEASASAEYGLDAPQLTVRFTSKQGATETLAIGKINPLGTSYYVRREVRQDTVLVSRYTLDDILAIANDVFAAG